MLVNATQALLSLKNNCKSVILFSSLTGKDSILLTHKCAEIFDNVIVIYMYVVKGYVHIEKWKNYYESTYKNVKIYEVPHYCLGSYIKSGYLGIKKDAKQKKYTLSDIDKFVKAKFNIEWSVYGMKNSDSLNRGLMLKSYRDNIYCDATKKCYPIATYRNKDVLKEIENLGLPNPIKYSNLKSQGQDIYDVNFLIWLRNNYPSDLKLTIEKFPFCEQLIYEYDNKIPNI